MLPQEFFLKHPLFGLARFVRRYNLSTWLLSQWAGIPHSTVIRAIRTSSKDHDVGYHKVLRILGAADELCQEDTEWKEAKVKFLEEEGTSK